MCPASKQTSHSSGLTTALIFFFILSRLVLVCQRGKTKGQNKTKGVFCRSCVKRLEANVT